MSDPQHYADIGRADGAQRWVVVMCAAAVTLGGALWFSRPVDDEPHNWQVQDTAAIVAGGAERDVTDSPAIYSGLYYPDGTQTVAWVPELAPLYFASRVAERIFATSQTNANIAYTIDSTPPLRCWLDLSHSNAACYDGLAKHAYTSDIVTSAHWLPATGEPAYGRAWLTNLPVIATSVYSSVARPLALIRWRLQQRDDFWFRGETNWTYRIWDDHVPAAYTSSPSAAAGYVYDQTLASPLQYGGTFSLYFYDIATYIYLESLKTGYRGYGFMASERTCFGAANVPTSGVPSTVHLYVPYRPLGTGPAYAWWHPEAIGPNTNWLADTVSATASNEAGWAYGAWHDWIGQYPPRDLITTLVSTSDVSYRVGYRYPAANASFAVLDYHFSHLTNDWLTR